MKEFDDPFPNPKIKDDDTKLLSSLLHCRLSSEISTQVRRRMNEREGFIGGLNIYIYI